MKIVRGMLVLWFFPASCLRRSRPQGDFRFRRDFAALPHAPSDDVFLIKFSYFLPI
jgi:hypothetical protein